MAALVIAPWLLALWYLAAGAGAQRPRCTGGNDARGPAWEQLHTVASRPQTLRVETSRGLDSWQRASLPITLDCGDTLEVRKKGVWLRVTEEVFDAR